MRSACAVTMLQSHGLAGRTAEKLFDGREITSHGGGVAAGGAAGQRGTPELNIALFHGASRMRLADILRRCWR